MNGFLLLTIKLLVGFITLIIIINVTGKGNLAPTSASDQIQNYVLGGIIGGVIYNNDIFYFRIHHHFSYLVFLSTFSKMDQNPQRAY